VIDFGAFAIGIGLFFGLVFIGKQITQGLREHGKNLDKIILHVDIFHHTIKGDKISERKSNEHRK